jgi:hypothetical protein
MGSKVAQLMVGIVAVGVPLAMHVHAPVTLSHWTRYMLPSGQDSITPHGKPAPGDGDGLTWQGPVAVPPVVPPAPVDEPPVAPVPPQGLQAIVPSAPHMHTMQLVDEPGSHLVPGVHVAPCTQVVVPVVPPAQVVPPAPVVLPPVAPVSPQRL